MFPEDKRTFRLDNYPLTTGVNKAKYYIQVYSDDDYSVMYLTNIETQATTIVWVMINKTLKVTFNVKLLSERDYVLLDNLANSLKHVFNVLGDNSVYYNMSNKFTEESSYKEDVLSVFIAALMEIPANSTKEFATIYIGENYV